MITAWLKPLEAGLRTTGGQVNVSPNLTVYVIAPHKQPPDIDTGASELEVCIVVDADIAAEMSD